MSIFVRDFLSGVLVLNLSWERVAILGVAAVLIIVSIISGRRTHPDWWKGEEWKIQAGTLLAVIVILFTIVDSDIWIILALLVAAAYIVISSALALHKITKKLDLASKMDLAPKTFFFPSGISFSYPGRYEIETENLDGVINLASLKDTLDSMDNMDIRKYPVHSPKDLYAQYQEWKNPHQTALSGIPPSFSVNLLKNKTGQTISDMYSHKKNSSKKTLQLVKTTIAGKEALLHEEFRHDEFFEQHIFHRTMTVLFDDNVINVLSVAYDINKFEECRAIAEEIENSLKFPSAWSFSPAASSYASVQPLGSNINKNNIHYLTLGLQHGATQEEIRAAFQRMTEKYHPDKDSSLDAQMKFHEARLAYDALMKANPL
jgi:hypothetical protein